MKRRKEESNWARDTGNVQTTREDFLLWNTVAMGLPVQRTIVFFFFFFFLRRVNSFIYLIKKYGRDKLSNVHAWTTSKKKLWFFENLKFLSSLLLLGITIIKISSLFLPYRKALCTSVLVYPFSSFLILSPRFEESFLCRSLRREKQMGRILFWSTLPVATNFDRLFKQQTALSVCLPAWFWENTRKFCKSLASSSYLTNFSRVLLTFRMVISPVNKQKVRSVAVK